MNAEVRIDWSVKMGERVKGKNVKGLTFLPYIDYNSASIFECRLAM